MWEILTSLEECDAAVIYWCQYYLDLNVKPIIRKNNKMTSEGKIIDTKSLKKSFRNMKSENKLALIYILEEIWFDAYCKGKNENSNLPNI